MTNQLWFSITVRDCNGQNLAQWNYDSMFPVIPPQFTYPNNDDRCPYQIEFNHIHSLLVNLPTNIDLNHAIRNETDKFANSIR